MNRCKFYVCPVCGNVIEATGEAVVSCCGITLPPQEAEKDDGEHALRVQVTDGDYYVSLSHPMTKDHYISFLSAVSDQRIQLVRLYPEGDAEARFIIGRVKYVYAYCNLFLKRAMVSAATVV